MSSPFQRIVKDFQRLDKKLSHRLDKILTQNSYRSATLVIAQMFTVSLIQSVIMEQMLDDFFSLGFDISNMGGGSFAIQGVPSGIEGLNPVTLVRNMLEEATEKGDVSKDEIHSTMALTMARSAAIVVGQVLSANEMTALIEELFACEIPAYAPGGKKVFTIITEEELDKRFV